MSFLSYLFVCLLGRVLAAELRVFSLQDGLISEVGGGAVSNLRKTLKSSHSVIPTFSSLTAGEVKGDYSFDDVREEQATKPKTVFRELPDRFRLSIEPRFGRYASTKDFSVTVIGNTLQVLEARYMGYGLMLDLHMPIAPEKLALPPHVALALDGSIQISVMKVPSAQVPLAQDPSATLSSLFGAPVAQAGLPVDLLSLITAAVQSGAAQVVTTISNDQSGTFHSAQTDSSGSSFSTSSTVGQTSSSSSSNSGSASSDTKEKKKLDAYESIRRAMAKKKSDKVAAAEQAAQRQARSAVNLVAPTQ